MERFRVEGDQIIERSSSNRNLIVVQERFDLPLALDPGSQNAYMATHWKFEASASTRFQTSGGPAVLHVLSGEPAITVTSDAAASGLRSPEVHEPESADSNPVTVDDIVRLAKGSTVTLPQGVGFVVSTPDGAASALFVSREGTSPLGPGIGVGLSNSVGGKARYLGSLPSNLEVETSLTARLHRIVLMPGALVSNLGTTGASTPLIWLEAGSVLTEHSRPAVYGAATVNINRQFVGGVRLSPDDEPAYLWEPAATLHNTSSEPAVLWVLSSDTPAE
jgi:hypothetical protein